MKCSASPTISTAAETTRDEVRSAAQRAVAAAVFAEVLKPFADAAGPLGSVLTTTIASRLLTPEPER